MNIAIKRDTLTNYFEFVYHRNFHVVSGSGACPECEIPLRRGNFKLQLFEDAFIDKEVEIRRRILRDFCKTREDFNSLHEFNDYLEMIEDMIYNLSNNIDVEETKRQIQDYKDANKEFINKNRNRVSSEKLELEDIIANEKRIEAKRKAEDALIDTETKTAKLKNKEKLIDDLMFSNTDAKSVIEEHQKAKFTSVSDFTSAKKDYVASARPILEAKPFVYQELLLAFEGPQPPLNESAVVKDAFNKHIRPAEEFEKAAGYVESIGALRALQEAMCSLYFDSF